MRFKSFNIADTLQERVYQFLPACTDRGLQGVLTESFWTSEVPCKRPSVAGGISESRLTTLGFVSLALPNRKAASSIWRLCACCVPVRDTGKPVLYLFGRGQSTLFTINVGHVYIDPTTVHIKNKVRI
jgi:hypothetical protein